MNYFDQLIKNIETTAAYIGKKAKDGIDIAKADKNLNVLYKQLGKISYEIHTGETKDVDKIEILCSQIEETLQLINELKQESEQQPKEIHSMQKEEINVETPPKPQAGQDGVLLLKFCPNCQIGNHPDAKKCISCGQVF